MKHILIVLGLVSVLSVSAQSLAQQPTSDFRSTSTMVGTGSTLPQAAQTGAVLSGTAPSAGIKQPFRPGTMRSTDPTPDPGNPFSGGGSDPEQEDVNKEPLGDALWPLMFLALAFAGYTALRRRRALSKK